jgi:hypothetical protein
MSRRLLVYLLVLALPLTLAACGGDDDGGGDDEAEITEAIQTSATSTDPADCTELQTTRFTEQSTFEVGDAALTQCEEDATSDTDNPDSVEVSNVSVDGENATADATFVGGPLDGSVVSLALVQEDDQWKLDELTDLPEFNFEGFQQAFTEEAAASGDLPPELADCLSQSFAQAGEEQVKAVIISGSGEELNALIAPCIPRG